MASKDEWFRPVNLKNGPDGAWYVVDMYRAVIEHPQFMPAELKNRPDLTKGDDLGRIYRIVSADSRPITAPRPQLSKATSASLVNLFERRNAWWRETAARLLFERQDKSVAPALAALARNGSPGTARVHALWALEGLQSLDEPTLVAALKDKSPRVREQGVVLAAGRMEKSPQLRAEVLGMAQDADPRVRFQAALAIGQAPGEGAIGALRHIGMTAAEDPWTRRAVEIAVPNDAGALLVAILRTLADPPAIQPGQLDLCEELAALSRAPSAIKTKSRRSSAR